MMRLWCCFCFCMYIYEWISTQLGRGRGEGVCGNGRKLLVPNKRNMKTSLIVQHQTTANSTSQFPPPCKTLNLLQLFTIHLNYYLSSLGLGLGLGRIGFFPLFYFRIISTSLRVPYLVCGSHVSRSIHYYSMKADLLVRKLNDLLLTPPPPPPPLLLCEFLIPLSENHKGNIDFLLPI